MRSVRSIQAVVLTILLLLPLALSACGASGAGSGGDGGKKPTALTSFYPLYFLTTSIAGDRFAVRNLVPAGTEPHDWEPSARDMAALRDAAVFVYNGAGFDAWAPKAIAANRSSKRIDVEATQGLPLAAAEGAEAKEFPNDPHVWLDPLLFKEMAAKVADALTRADPAGKETFAANLAALQGRLDELHGAYTSGLRDCARRELVTSHAAFGYLARRYGLEQIAVEGLAPDEEPTPARIAEVTRTARERGATHIYFETLVIPRVAETIAREIGAQTLVLDPLEGLDDEKSGREDYVSVMTANLANLRTGLGCR